MNLRSILGWIFAARTTARTAQRLISPKRSSRSRQKSLISLRTLVVVAVLGGAAYFGFRGMEWRPSWPLGENQHTTTGSPGLGQATPPAVVPVGGEQAAAQQTLIIGSFNIQTFGRAKMQNPSVMGILVDVARRFDLLAIQELRSTEQDIIPKFAQMVNADGSNYRYIVGPRQGHTISKEQYVYLYDANKLAPIAPPYVATDASGQFHRSPLVAHFRSLEIPPDQAFSFILLNVHTDPDEIRFEIPELRTIIERVRRENPGEDDIIILGDFNAPPRFFLPYQWFAHPYAAIDDDWTTNVRENRNYDNLVFDQIATREFTGRRGVLNFRRTYQLELEDALKVSDHFPVWAEFSIYETPTRTPVTGAQNTGALAPALR
ncbi:MAG TPA: endonuclease/exonuclease/phosphatase [Pirellulaceae bacterium]|nr:endonuclease/exonuclease/phosphatase [Pirellulaceae bacterium]